MMIFMLLFWFVLIVLCVSIMRSIFNPYEETYSTKRKRLPVQHTQQTEIPREQFHALFNDKHNQPENDHVY